MSNTDKDILLLESMIGASISTTGNVQVAVNKNLPLSFPQNIIHYELYNNHIELHVESSIYKPLCTYLERTLPNNEKAKTEKRNFCEYAYVLSKRVQGLNNIVELGNAFIELRDIVEPFLIQYCEQLAGKIELAKELGDYYEKQEANIPFHINVIDELHANENAHTRILIRLLDYKEDGKRVILESFLQMLPTFNVDSFDIEKSKVYFNRDYIDGLIEKSGEFAVIIENKIHWAVDQNNQIDNYVKTKIDQGIPPNNIWVIYLTRDGRKKVEGYSLTEDTKKILGGFVEMDYYHHILPWLKEKVLPNCRVKEEWLESAIKQYIDHLEGLFDIRESKIKLQKMVQDKIWNSLECTKNMSSSDIYLRLEDYYNNLEELQSIVRNSMESIINPFIERLKDTTINVLGCPEEKISFKNEIHNGYFQVLFTKWTKQVHFEWIPFNEHTLFGTEYTFVLHVERDDLRESFKQVLCNSDSKNKASGIGLDIDTKDISVFYKRVFHAQKSMFNMTDKELSDFLSDVYKDVNSIQDFVSEKIININN